VDDWLTNNNALQGKMIMQVHDELVFEVPNHEVETFKEMVPKLMNSVASLDVPLVTDIGEGDNWEQAH
jgi:DNA polymerase-1